MPAGLLPGHDHVPDARRIQVLAGLVEQQPVVGAREPRQDTLAKDAAGPVAPVRVEPETNHRAAVPFHIRDDGDDGHRHVGEIDERVAPRGGQADGALADLGDRDHANSLRR